MNEATQEDEIDMKEFSISFPEGLVPPDVSSHKLALDHEDTFSQEPRAPEKGTTSSLSISSSSGVGRTLRLFNFWRGNNIFWLNGSILYGVNSRRTNRKMTQFFLLSTFFLYIMFPANYLYARFSQWHLYSTSYSFLMSLLFLHLVLMYSPLKQNRPGNHTPQRVPPAPAGPAGHQGGRAHRTGLLPPKEEVQHL